jgi:SAM-dependent methyltransferase
LYAAASPQLKGVLVEKARAAHLNLHSPSEPCTVGQRRGGHAAKTAFRGFILRHIHQNRITSPSIGFFSSRRLPYRALVHDACARSGNNRGTALDYYNQQRPRSAPNYVAPAPSAAKPGNSGCSGISPERVQRRSPVAYRTGPPSQYYDLGINGLQAMITSMTNDMEHSPVTRSFRLISHNAHADPANQRVIDEVKTRLRADGDLPAATLEHQLALVDQLSAFELGRFLLVNRGLDACWTHRLVTYEADSLQQGAVPELEYLIFERLPAVLATRERFKIFRRELQTGLRPGFVLASVPCGWMGDLLLLDYDTCPDVRLLGLDLDKKALDGAYELANERGLAQQVELRQADAWEMDLNAEVDLLTSNGLNIYESNNERVVSLYLKFFDALRPGGQLVTSFLTPPPTLSNESPWDMNAAAPTLLALQQVLFARIVEAKWSAFRTHSQTLEQLERVGFRDVTFVNDRACMFPTVIAHKPC